jgi:hypothetical protein
VQDQDNRTISQADVIDLEGQHSRAPQLLPSFDAAAAYRLVYGRIDALLRGRADVAELTVPACPAWTVRQTLAHLAGVAQDIVSLNLQGGATDLWTQAQVDRLGGNSIDELLDLWGQMIGPVTARLGQAPEGPAGQTVFDALTHEHDIRSALGEPAFRTRDPAFAVAGGFLTTMLDAIIRQTELPAAVQLIIPTRHAGLPALRLMTPTMGSLQLGDPDTATDQLILEVSDFEALRAFGGRRSVRQLLALPWQGDPTNLLRAFGNHAIRPPNDDLVE